MKGVIIRKFGDISVLSQENDIPTPELNDEEVLIKVKYCALNHLDIWIRNGLTSYNTKLPHILGCDVSGVVEKVGKNVSEFKNGDEVFISPGLSCWSCEYCLKGEDNRCVKYGIVGATVWGGYAEYIKVNKKNLLHKPENISFENASAFPLVFLTSWHMIVTRAELKPNQTILILGASSGLGQAAIQISKLLNANVIAATSSDEKLKKAKGIGADEVVNYYDFEKKVKAITNGEGVDCVFEHIGKDTFAKSIKVLKKGGKLITCGATTGQIAEIDIRYLFARHISILGSTMGSFQELKDITKLISNGKLKPVIDSVFPIEDVKEAHRKMESRSFFGKILLKLSVFCCFFAEIILKLFLNGG